MQVFLFWQLIETLINSTHGVKKGSIWVPNYRCYTQSQLHLYCVNVSLLRSVRRDLRIGVALTPDELFPLVHAGRITGHRAEIVGFRDGNTGSCLALLVA